MISIKGFDRTQYDFIVKHHAFIRALQRRITPDMIEATLKGGTIQWFGKNCLKLSKQYRSGTIICVGEIVGTTIKILTIERKP